MGNLKPVYIDIDSGQLKEPRAGDILINEPDIIVNSISDLIGDNIDKTSTRNTKTVMSLGYYSVGDGGGGTFYWDSNENKSNHNGGTVISPTWNNGTFGNTTDPNWFRSDPNDTNNGCWVVTNTNKVSALQFGAKGNYGKVGEVDDTLALQALFDNHNNIDLHNRGYLISTTLIAKDVTIHTDNAKLHGVEDFPQDNNRYLIATGETNLSAVLEEAQENYRTLEQDSSKGTNRIHSSLLAGDVQKGDLVQITSDKTRYNSYIGELQTVLGVDVNNGTVDLSGGLHDSYLTTDTAKATKVKYTTFNTVGTLELVHHAPNPIDEVRGLLLIYTLHSNIDVKCVDCQEMGVNVTSCYSPKININATNSTRSVTGDSYGIDLFGPVMNARINGVIAGGRHCFASGSALGYNGIAWNIKVEIIGYGSGFSSVFDAHKEVGSVYYENCIAIGGDKVYNESGNINDVNGYVTSAKENYINNCTYYGAGIALADRAGDIDIFSVNGFTTTRAGDLYNTEGPNTKELILRNIHAKSDRGFIFSDGTIQNITMSNINWVSTDTATTFMDISDRMNMPSITKLDNCNFRGLNSPTMFDLDSPDLSFILNNCLFENMGIIFQLRKATERVEVNNCNFEEVEQIVIVDNAVKQTIKKINFHGGNYNIVNAFDYLCYIGPDSVVNEFGLSDTSISDNVTRIMASGGMILEKVIMGANDMENVSSIFAGSFTEVLAGGGRLPLVTRGEGSPNGVVFAPIGSLYMDKNGSTNTTLYIKETNDGGASGWVAK